MRRGEARSKGLGMSKAVQLQMSESLRLALILAFAGGFLDAYTYVMRGGVFANAQTGNIVLFGISLFSADFSAAFRFFIPITAFTAGIFVAESIRKAFTGFQSLHWRHPVLFIECAVLAASAFIPASHNMWANALVSFVCSLQVETFRKVHGSPYATTMCTGNLRSASENLFIFATHGDREKLTSGLNYFIIIGAFALGAGAGAVVSRLLGLPSVLFPAGFLLAAAVLMLRSPRTE